MPSVALPVVSALTAGVLILGQMTLLLAVVLRRRSARQSLGDGGDAKLLASMRRHGNFAENAAIFVVCLALVEMLGTPRGVVMWSAGVFVAGRVLHAIGLSMPRTVNPWRIAGVVATVGPAVTVGVRLITLALPLLR